MMSCSRASEASASAALRTLARWTSAVIGSPRFRSALPPSATTIRISGSQCGDKDRLDGVHAVLGLIENNGSFGFEDFFRHLHAFDAVSLEDLLADLGLAIVEGGQAMHELGVRVAAGAHDVRGDAIGRQQLDALFPDRVGLAHRYPD